MKKALLVLRFQTGDSDAPYYDFVAVFYCQGENDINELIDSMFSFLDTEASEDMEYDEIAREVLNASGHSWEEATDSIPASDFMRIIEI